MKLIKPTGQSVVPIDVKTADSFFARLLGLMFRKQLPEGEALWLIPCNSIHMFFMRFPLDVVFLDHAGQIVGLVQGIRPWRFTLPVKGAYSAVEFAAGTIGRYGLEIGDRLELA